MHSTFDHQNVGWLTFNQTGSSWFFSIYVCQHIRCVLCVYVYLCATGSIDVQSVSFLLISWMVYAIPVFVVCVNCSDCIKRKRLLTIQNSYVKRWLTVEDEMVFATTGGIPELTVSQWNKQAQLTRWYRSSFVYIQLVISWLMIQISSLKSGLEKKTAISYTIVTALCRFINNNRFF